MNQVITHPPGSLELISGDFKGKDILSLDQFSAADLYRVFALAREMKELVLASQPSQLLAGQLVALLFYEPSSRTFGSFAAAVKRLGGQTLDIQNPEVVSSVWKGESFEDTISVFGAYTQAIVLRHPLPGAAQRAAEVANVPVINAGDGNNEHPTQTLLDLFTIYEQFGRLDHLKGLLAGDPLNSRTLHSLIRGLALFEGNTVYLLSPEALRLTREDLLALRSRGIEIVEIHSEREIPTDCHFWYWTRIQKERLSSLDEYQQLAAASFQVTPALLAERANREMILMDPLPRVGTIDPAVDSDERAVYLRSQIRNGLYTRMALLALILGKA
ncbi:MAG: aspartate carbamoyltransferase [Thermogemmatispora sp.]|jgi:aspartate carbamoyltransferase catalytic subunit|uniref:aspartate carbamoyltransferase n=1 Tax=Thermogemmatispora sp. TaxID=1968838 RepID=UPI0019FE3390|nr:aspartate carbamoyltransferase [Thermogemmatispora sp.]MBE3564727.1 aspartate carbamoyltransferase [Thermogemmatispora sp.]